MNIVKLQQQFELPHKAHSTSKVTMVTTYLDCFPSWYEYVVVQHFLIDTQFALTPKQVLRTLELIISATLSYR